MATGAGQHLSDLRDPSETFLLPGSKRSIDCIQIEKVTAKLGSIGVCVCVVVGARSKGKEEESSLPS